MNDLLKAFQRRLTNLTGSNKSLFHLRAYAQQDIDLHDLDFLLNRSSYGIIQDLIARKGKIELCEVIDSRNAGVNNASQALSKINRRDQFIFQERGARDLYIGYPYVEGKLMDGTPIRCPLLFFPVELNKTNTHWELILRKNVNVTFNQSFLLAFAHYNQKMLSDEVYDRTFNDSSRDTQVFRTELYTFLKSVDVALNFNQELFADQLQYFKTYKKKDFEDSHENGELKLVPNAILGIFQQAGSYLIPDYTKLLKINRRETLEEFFEGLSLADFMPGAPSSYFDRIIREDQTYTPFAIDAYQEEALKKVKQGKSIVVQGPPGSGKSQLICNMVADFVARGKKVLVVSQKRAALDVVHERLAKAEIDRFVALVHDFKNDRKTLYDQIDYQIEHLKDYEYLNNSLDAIYLERNFLQSSRKIDQVCEELTEFKEALFENKECGFSAKELYLTSDLSKEWIELRREYEFFKAEQIKEFADKVKRYAPYKKRLASFLKNCEDRVSFQGFDINDLYEIEKCIEEIPVFEKEFNAQVISLLGDPVNLEDTQWILDRRPIMDDLLSLIKTERVFTFFKHLLKNPPDHDWLLIREQRIIQSFKGGMEYTIASADLGKFQEALESRINAGKNFVSRIKWELFGKERKWVKKVLIDNLLTNSKDDIYTLTELVDNRLNFEHNRTKLKKQPWLLDVPEGFDQMSYQQWFDDINAAVAAKDISSELRSLLSILHVEVLDQNQLKIEIDKLESLCKEAEKKKMSWHKYLTPSQIHRLIIEIPYGESFLAQIKKEFENIVEHDTIQKNFTSQQEEVFKKLIEHTGEFNAERIEALFINSINIAWINHLETKYPVLKAVSTLRFQQLEKDLQEAIKEKNATVKDILKLRLREGTYKGVEYNRLSNRITYRDLQHQVTKKKRIWPLRKTIENHFEELFDLIPCWLASPESVSALFPMQKVFDLVIFDEASQCFVEKGFPSIMRAKQIVIAGDSQQLQPDNLYAVRFEDENEEDSVDLEKESLLELSQVYLPQIQLNGHYRSKRLDLIEFSNQQFYNGKLRLIPFYEDVKSTQSSIDYIKLDGVWEKNVNEVEAEKIADMVIFGIRDGVKNIGVVTFNNKQQELIQDCIETRSASLGVPLPTDLFVKNIENVQGDERDWIIFSIGYAPSLSGRFMMNFGTLNQEGGENRLNVAITRAKSKISIVTSILPHQLEVENSLHRGPKLLREYLTYAFEVSQGNFNPVINQYATSDYSWNLSEKIAELTQSQSCFSQRYPFADLTFTHKDGREELIFTDDRTYHSSPSVKDAHAYVPLLLSTRKWQTRRYFSRKFWKNKDELSGELNRLIEL